MFSLYFQSQILELASAVINGYLDQVKQLVFFNSSDESCFCRCLIDACPQVNVNKIAYSSVH